MTDREMFEDWAKHLMLERQGDHYVSHYTNHAWCAWCASREKALQDAMAECNRQADHETDMGRSKEAFGCDLCVGVLSDMALSVGKP